MRFAPLLLLLASSSACRDATGERLAPSGLTKKKVAAKVIPGTGVEPMETTYDKMLAAREEQAAKKNAADGKAVKEGDDWVPAEYKTGAARWRDVGVYVDGKPAGFLTWGELPVSLPVTWIEDLVSTEKNPGDPGDGTRKVRQRFYRFDQYLKAIGVDVRQVKEMHVYGPRLTQSNISTAKDLTSPAAKEFFFRFGSNTSGKPIPRVPQGFGNGRSADKISGVMVYVKKKPPEFRMGEGFFLDGEKQDGVPYFGDPVRGGIRVYLDDKLAGIIKRQDLDAKRATKTADGVLTWNLPAELEQLGVDTSRVKQVWAIRDDLRKEHWTGDDLKTMTFAANAQNKGGILLTDKHVRANVIALHTRVLSPDEIPAPTPDDDSADVLPSSGDGDSD